MQNSEYQPFTKRVLVVGQTHLNLASALNFLYESGFDSIGVLTAEEAHRFFEEHNPHIILFYNVFDKDMSDALKQDFFKKNQTLTFLELSGGISALKLLLKI